ncbi:MAG: glycosyltransferase [Deltaproteobacteria bacterium]|nr:glycosyltransferase [Deltaproteobacteria bacterium]
MKHALSDGGIGRALGYARFAQPQCRVVVLDGEYHLHGECIRALTAEGHHVARVPVAVDERPADVVRKLLLCCVREKPDFVLSINQIGFDDQGMLAGLLEQLSLPMAVWFVDSPLYVLRGMRAFAPSMTSYFSWERRYVTLLGQAGAEAVHYLPLASDPERFRLRDASCQRAVSFVGDSMLGAQQRFRRRLSTNAQRRVAPLVRELLADRQFDLFDAKVTASDRQRSDLLAYVTWQATGRYRCEVLSQIRSHRLHVYGDPGWSQLLPEAITHGPLNYGEPLADVYRTSAVNINMTSLQMPSAVNQRVFDVPLCGGFVISDRQSDLLELFDEQREVVCFNHVGELDEMVSYYARRPAERQAISRRARQRILAAHTYRHRLREMIERLRERFAPLRQRSDASRQPSVASLG